MTGQHDGIGGTGEGERRWSEQKMAVGADAHHNSLTARQPALPASCGTRTSDLQAPVMPVIAGAAPPFVLDVGAHADDAVVLAGRQIERRRACRPATGIASVLVKRWRGHLLAPRDVERQQRVLWGCQRPDVMTASIWLTRCERIVAAVALVVAGVALLLLIAARPVTDIAGDFDIHAERSGLAEIRSGY